MFPNTRLSLYRSYVTGKYTTLAYLCIWFLLSFKNNFFANPLIQCLINIIMRCYQCETGAKLYENCTYQSIIDEYRRDNISLLDMLYNKLIPFVIYLEHRKYCEKTNPLEDLRPITSNDDV